MQNHLDLRVRIAPHAQLAISIGVVEGRVQKLNAGRSVLGRRIFRGPYEVKYIVEHEPAKPWNSQPPKTHGRNEERRVFGELHRMVGNLRPSITFRSSTS